MRRREFIAGLGGAAAWSLAARAQQADRMRRIGVLLSLTADDPLFGVTARKCSDCTTSGTLPELRPPVGIAAAAAV